MNYEGPNPRTPDQLEKDVIERVRTEIINVSNPGVYSLLTITERMVGQWLIWIPTVGCPSGSTLPVGWAFSLRRLIKAAHQLYTEIGERGWHTPETG